MGGTEFNVDQPREVGPVSGSPALLVMTPCLATAAFVNGLSAKKCDRCRFLRGNKGYLEMSFVVLLYLWCSECSGARPFRPKV